MKYYISYIKVILHCVRKTFANMNGEDHRIATLEYSDKRREVLCTCKCKELMEIIDHRKLH